MKKTFFYLIHYSRLFSTTPNELVVKPPFMVDIQLVPRNK